MEADAWDLCMTCADRVLALEPQHFQGLFTRAEALSGLDREAEAVAAYQECVAERMKMAAEDGQRIAEECQKGMTKVSRALSNGWPTGRT